MTHRSRARTGAFALAIALVATGCGSSKSSSGGPTTTAAVPGTGGGGFAVKDGACPADAKTVLAAGAPIKLGVTLPKTGALAAFGVLGDGMKVFFDKVNAEKGGVDGHKIELIVKDDGYEPPRSVTNTQELIEQQKVLGTVLDVGSPNVAGTRAAHETSCTPQLWVGTGLPNWGDPANHQWTTGGITAYNTEAKVWAELIAKEKPGAKVAQLVFNNDFGKSYQKTFEAAAKAKGLTIVETRLHEATAPAINNEVTALIAATPDYVIGETTGAFCPKLMAGLAQGGYKGKTIISATCASVKSFFAPVDPAGNGVLIVGAQKDPSDKQYDADPAMVTYKADVAKYGGGANPADGSVLTGYNIAALTVANLAQAAKAGGISRVSLMNAAWNTNTTLPLALGGKTIIDGNKDAYAAEYLAILKYDATLKSQVLTTDVFDVEGKTGLFGA